MLLELLSTYMIINKHICEHVLKCKFNCSKRAQRNYKILKKTLLNVNKKKQM